MPSSVTASRAFLLSEERKLIMYIDEKINNSKSNKILVVGQPMSGMTFSACKYAVEQAYLGKTVYILRDTKQQLTCQGGLNDTLKRVQDAYKELRGEYSGEVLTRSTQVTEGRGCFGDILIYDNCRNRYSGPKTFSRWECREKEIIMSYYKDIKEEYGSLVAQGYEVIEATTEENIAGVKANPAYLAYLHSLSHAAYEEYMELPSDKDKPVCNLVWPTKLTWCGVDLSDALVPEPEPQGYISLHKGGQVEFKPSGDVIINDRVTVTKDGHVIVSGGAK